MTVSHVVDLTLNALVTHLTEQMITNVPDGDITKADVVKLGLLQVAKTKQNIQVGVQGGDHEEPEQADGIITMQELPKIGVWFPAREVGGGQTWIRRGVCQLEAYFIREKLTEEEASLAAYEILGRLMASIETCPVQGVLDGFGERIVTIYCYANTYFESGGPPKSYIYRGKVKWAIVTERP